MKPRIGLTPSNKWLAGLAAILVVIAACQSPAPKPQPQLQKSAWQPVDLPGLHSGFRAATYDQSRDCLWIVARVFNGAAANQEVVKLVRLNTSDGSVVNTGVELSGAGYIQAGMVLDGGGNLWMAWGRSLFEYTPATGSVHTYKLPSFASLGVQVHLYMDGMDGNIVGLALDSTGEIWVAAYKVAGVFGFNPARSSWDRTVRLPWFPYDRTRLAAPGPGILTINGFRSPDGKVFKNTFAKIDTTTGRVTQLSLSPDGYVLLGRNDVLYVERNGDIGTFNLGGDSPSVLVTHAPLDLNSILLVPDDQGHVWFSMGSYRNIGIAELNLSSGSVTQFPFPYIDSPGQHVPEKWSCAGMFDCIPSSAVYNAGVQAISLDQHGHVWVVTEVDSHPDATNLTIPSPVYELTSAG